MRRRRCRAPFYHLQRALAVVVRATTPSMRRRRPHAPFYPLQRAVAIVVRATTT